MPDPAPNPPSDPTPSGDASRQGPRIVRPQKRLSATVERYVLKHGNLQRAIEAVAAKNIKLGDTIATLETENEALKKSAPAQGAIVLTGDDAKKWEKVKAIPLDGDKIAERVKKADELETTVSASARAKTIAEIATAANLNGETLAPLLKPGAVTPEGFDVESRPVQVHKDGKTETVQVPSIRKAGDANAQWEPLADFVTKDGSPLKPFAPALAKSGTPAIVSPVASGFVFPDQSGRKPDSGTSGASALDKVLQANAERSKQANPLTGAPHTQTPVVGGVPSHSLANKKAS